MTEDERIINDGERLKYLKTLVALRGDISNLQHYFLRCPYSDPRICTRSSSKTVVTLTSDKNLLVVQPCHTHLKNYLDSGWEEL